MSNPSSRNSPFHSGVSLLARVQLFKHIFICDLSRRHGRRYLTMAILTLSTLDLLVPYLSSLLLDVHLLPTALSTLVPMLQFLQPAMLSGHCPICHPCDKKDIVSCHTVLASYFFFPVTGIIAGKSDDGNLLGHVGRGILHRSYHA